MATFRHETRIFVGKLRRLFAVHFRQGYVARQLRNRQGDCHQCGTCCHFTIACPMLTKDQLCRVYGKCRPKACRVFPLDQKDIDDVTRCGGTCGYIFDDVSGVHTGTTSGKSRTGRTP
ncbi:hypothetical protein DesfrDRAFT_1684 [Solidesulfovibrio fructosivorans JJ]]|uniref:Uncharacterized protein n=1 Tax=Solidesulfovibrio fructosivorans JJ] TaxID=596151 RepID=E1JVN5_SOLFR|nr:hypothetical protein DesfrDRAFT_1684 [Solidesulfovibrio fructosivorans JJ]]